MKVIFQKNIPDLFYIIYNLPFLLCLEILNYGGFAIAKYDTYKEKYTCIEERDIDFSMIITKEILDRCNYFETFFSKAIMPFYLGVIGTVIILMFVF